MTTLMMEVSAMSLNSLREERGARAGACCKPRGVAKGNVLRFYCLKIERER